MSRNINIELLRCLAMLGVVFLHCSNYPYKGLAGASVVDDFLITLFHSISWASVNILVLITGYFTMTSESGRFLKFRKMTKMYFQMWFYALVFFLIGKYILGSDSSLTPLSSGMWWYMTEYFKLMLIAPFIVRAVQSIDRQQYLVMTALFVIVFGVIHLVADGGFGFLWFVTLFLVGGGMKKYNILRNISTSKLMIYYLIVLFLFLINRLLRSSYTFRILTITYDNILVLTMAVLLLEFFSRITISGNFCYNKAISFIAPCTLGVYLIHTHPIVQDFIWIKFSEIFPEKRFIIILLGTVACFVTCVIIDYFRKLLFKLMKVDFLINKSFDRLNKVVLHRKSN